MGSGRDRFSMGVPAPRNLGMRMGSAQGGTPMGLEGMSDQKLVKNYRKNVGVKIRHRGSTDGSAT